MSLDTVKPKGMLIQSYDRLSQILIDPMEVRERSRCNRRRFAEILGELGVELAYIARRTIRNAWNEPGI
jgi:hypothetical protein